MRYRRSISTRRDSRAIADTGRTRDDEVLLFLLRYVTPALLLLPLLAL